MEIYIAIDLGTTGCRSILFDENLKIHVESYEEYSLITPKENWVEQDANLWWEMTLRTVKNAILNSKIDNNQIKGISVSSQGITIVPVDCNLTPLCNALSWLDTRAELEVLKIKKILTKRLCLILPESLLMYDLKENIWSDKLLETYDIPKDKLPLILESGKSIGTIKDDIATELGISNTCIVSVRAQDQKCAALGASLKDDGADT